MTRPLSTAALTLALLVACGDSEADGPTLTLLSASSDEVRAAYDPAGTFIYRIEILAGDGEEVVLYTAVPNEEPVISIRDGFAFTLDFVDDRYILTLANDGATIPAVFGIQVFAEDLAIDRICTRIICPTCKVPNL